MLSCNIVEYRAHNNFFPPVECKLVEAYVSQVISYLSFDDPYFKHMGTWFIQIDSLNSMMRIHGSGRKILFPIVKNPKADYRHGFVSLPDI